MDKLGRGVGQALEARGMTEAQALAELEQTKQEVVEEKYGRVLKPRRRKTP